LMVLKRQVGRPHLRRRDRLFMAAISGHSLALGARCSWSARRPCFGGTGSWYDGSGRTVGRQWRQTSDQRGGSEPGPADEEGEPEVGMHPDPWRARQGSHQGLGDEDPYALTSERPRPGSPASWSHLE
jgi:hypothetical protein